MKAIKISPRNVSRLLASLIMTCSLSLANASNFIHATYLRGAGIQNIDEIEHSRFSQFNFIYLKAAPDWTAADLDGSAEDVLQKIIQGPHYPVGDRGLSLVPALIARAHGQGVKVLLSTNAPDFPLIAKSEAKRLLFAKAMVAFIDKYGYDGIDIDWERSLEMNDYLALMSALRRELEAFSQRTKPSGVHRYLTTALHATPHFPEKKFSAEQAERLSATVDWVNIMTYDMGGGLWGNRASHNSPLNTIKSRLEKSWANFPPEKMCIGLASYGFKYNSISPGELLFAKIGKRGRYFAYRELPGLLGQGWTENFESGAEASYYFSPDKNEFVSIDNTRSLSAKVQWVLSNSYRGVFWWEFHQDYIPATGTAPYATHLLVDEVERLLPREPGEAPASAP